MTSTSHKMKAAGIALAAYGIFSMADAIVKLQSESYPLAQVTFMIEALSALILFVHAAATGTIRNLYPREPGFTYFRALLLAVETALIYYAFSTIPLPEVYVLAFLVPVFVALISFLFLKERLSLTAAFGVALGFAGVVVALRPSAGCLQLGHFAAIASAFLFAITLVMVKRAHPHESNQALTLSPCLLLGASCLIHMLFTGEWRPLTLYSFLVFLAGSLAVVGASILLIRAFRLGEPSLVAPTQYSQILWGTLLSYMLFQTGLDIYTVAGAATIIVSGLLVLK
jgi:S-adenosylmethionine uptake transporter